MTSVREFAEQVLLSPDLEDKLLLPSGPFDDRSTGETQRLEVPARTANLEFAPRNTAPKMPKLTGLGPEHRRGLAHHIMANHELQALEVMAWTLLAFPDAPTEFRLGMVEIMKDEQRHTRMHMERAERLGVPFGSQPVNCYIWKKAMEFESALDYVAGLPLVFEGANLDHTIEFAAAFEGANDTRGAALMKVIHRDEIDHVRFGFEWLNRMKPETQSSWEAWQQHLKWPLRPNKARGDQFQRQARLAAGLPAEFIDQIEQYVDVKPE